MLSQCNLAGVLALTIATTVTACSFNGDGAPVIDAGLDATKVDVDAALLEFDVQFVSVDLVGTPTLRAGSYGITVEAMLENQLDVEITDVQVSLRFTEAGTDRRGFFRWRSVDRRDGPNNINPKIVGPGATETFRFKLDALPSAELTEAIEIDGVAAFLVGNQAASAVGLETPTFLVVDAINTIVVDTVLDNSGVAGSTSFRDAFVDARASPAPDRIVFDETIFPSGSRTAINIDSALDPFPVVDLAGNDLVIEGGDDQVELAVDGTWDGRQEFAFRVDGPKLVVSNVAFRNWAFNYASVDLTNGNCGPVDNVQGNGGTISVVEGTLVLDGNRFADPDVAERDCYGTAIRLDGGSGHRILGNHFTDQAMDSIAVDAQTIEITSNIFDAVGSSTTSDDGLLFSPGLVNSFWVIGNLFVDLEFSGILLTQIPNATVYVVHNTFVRSAQAALYRQSTDGIVIMRNNLFIDNTPNALGFNADNGNGVDIDYSHVSGSALCSVACLNIEIGLSNISADPQVTNINGTTRAEFTPMTGSPLIDSGVDWIDRNGPIPRRFNGNGPDRGAVEAN